MSDDLRDELVLVVENETGGCICDEAYTSRARIDPQCYEFHICLSLVPEIVPVVERRIAQARAEAWSEGWNAGDDFAEAMTEWIADGGIDSGRERPYSVNPYQEAAYIARQHAAPDASPGVLGAEQDAKTEASNG